MSVAQLHPKLIANPSAMDKRPPSLIANLFGKSNGSRVAGPLSSKPCIVRTVFNADPHRAELYQAKLYQANNGHPKALAGGEAAKGVEHDPEKWMPIFRKDHAQSKS